MTSTPLAKLIEIWTAWETESDSCDSSPTEILAVAGILRTPRQHFKGYREAPSEVSITALVVVSICIQYFKLLQACYLNHCDVTVSYVCNSQTWWYFWVAHLPKIAQQIPWLSEFRLCNPFIRPLLTGYGSDLNISPEWPRRVGWIHSGAALWTVGKTLGCTN